jgi:PAS domain S-box-containing protein
MSKGTQPNIDLQTTTFERKISSKKETQTHARVTKKKKGSVALPRAGSTLADYFNSTFDFAGIGIAILNLDGRILDVNSALCNFTGFSRSELIKADFLEIGHPEDKENDQLMLRKMSDGRVNFYSLEKRYVSKQRRILWGKHTLSKVYSKSGEHLSYILQIIDVTRKREVINLLSCRDAEIDAIRATLIHKIAQIEELNRIIAHNLRGPANNVSLLVDMIKEKHIGRESTGLVLEMEEIISYLEEGSTALTSSLNTLTEIAHLSINKDISFDKCDVAEIIGKVLHHFSTAIYEKAAVVTLDISVPVIDYPRVFLESIVHNLVGNAIRYSSADRVPEITVKTAMADGKIQLSVTDNGLGIDLIKYGTKIFKLNQVFHKEIGNKGVGLYMTRAQVESLGGKITVKSQVNQGAHFVITF